MEDKIIYILIFLFALFLSTIFTKISLKILPRFGFMDRKESHSTHGIPSIRGGGIAIFLTFFIVVALVVPIDRKLVGMFLGALIILIVNIVDDMGKVKVTPFERLFWETIGIFVVIGSGIGIDNITNPFTSFP